MGKAILGKPLGANCGLNLKPSGRRSGKPPRVVYHLFRFHSYISPYRLADCIPCGRKYSVEPLIARGKVRAFGRLRCVLYGTRSESRHDHMATLYGTRVRSMRVLIDSTALADRSCKTAISRRPVSAGSLRRREQWHGGEVEDQRQAHVSDAKARRLKTKKASQISDWPFSFTPFLYRTTFIPLQRRPSDGWPVP